MRVLVCMVSDIRLFSLHVSTPHKLRTYALQFLRGKDGTEIRDPPSWSSWFLPVYVRDGHAAAVPQLPSPSWNIADSFRHSPPPPASNVLRGRGCNAIRPENVALVQSCAISIYLLCSPFRTRPGSLDLEQFRNLQRIVI